MTVNSFTEILTILNSIKTSSPFVSSSSVIMTFTIVFSLLLFSCAQQLAAAQSTLPEYCTNGTASDDYSRCLSSNSATCAYCDSEINVYISSGASVCTDLTDEVCPFFHCCSKCEAEAKRYYECDVFPVEAVTNPEIQFCTVDCSTFPYGDIQNVGDELCVTKWESWNICFYIHQDSCLKSCNNFESLDDQLTDDNECAALQKDLCYYSECCPSCQSEYSAYFQCVMEPSISTLKSTCPLSCNGVDFNGKQTNSGTGIKTSTAKNVVLILLSILLL